MRRERITEQIYVFTSQRYAQVNAGVVLTDSGAVVIGTLVYPDETGYIKRFVEERLHSTVRYVINTHYHADHTNGTCFFPDATVVSHDACRRLLDQHGRDSLRTAQDADPELEALSVVLPHVTFTDSLTLYLGDKTLRLWHLPGHTPDSIVCLVEEEQVFFGGDTVMPIPYFIDGDYDALLKSLRSLQGYTFENVIPGYGEVILRGEVAEKIQSDVDYLLKLKRAVHNALAQPEPQAALKAIDIEACGKSRILLNGIVEKLHRQNVDWLGERLRHTQPDYHET